MNAVVDVNVDRSSYIGGSDAAAAINLNPYQSQFDLWQEKLQLVPAFEGNEATKWGKIHEPAVRQETAERTGLVIRLPQETLYHPKYPFAGCHPDGLTDDGRLYEGKTARFPFGFGEDGSDDVPESYRIQCQHNMGIVGATQAILSALIGGSELRIFYIDADPELQGLIFEAESRFWHYVTVRQPPPPDCSRPDAMKVLARMYPGTNGKALNANEEAEQLRAAFHEHAKLEADSKLAKEAAKAGLLALMGEATFLQFPDGKSLRRATVNRKAYSVAATSYMDARFVNS